MKKTFLIFTLFAGLVAMSSCGSYQKIGDLTVISTRNFDTHAEYAELRRYVKAVGKSEKDAKAMETAINNAIKQVPGGEYMKNVTLYMKGDKIRVEGDVWGVAGKETQMDEDAYRKMQKKKEKEAYKKEKQKLKEGN